MSARVDARAIPGSERAALWHSPGRRNGMATSLDDHDRLRRERDLYLRLLELGGQ